MVLTVLSLGARLMLALATDIYSDEAYYWTWSKHLQLSYFDHPALIAWSIAALGVRTGAALWGVATLAGVFRLTRSLGGDRSAAWWATALFASTPAANLLASFATPDAPLLAFWAWALVAIVEQRAALVGVLWGLAMLSKYNGILLGLPVLMGFWRTPWRLVGAGLLAFVVTSPTLIWNALNDWEGFRFQFAHGLGGGGGWNTFGEFLAGQLGMAGPVLLALVVVWLTRSGNPMLKVATLLPLVFFGYASFKARGEANWAAAAWLPASVGVALLPWRRWQLAAASLNVFVVVAGAALLSWPPRPLWPALAVRKLHGWAILARARDAGVPVITNRYQLSSLVTWYSGLPSTTFAGRRSQYDLWPLPPEFKPGADALWIGDFEDPPAELSAKFERATDLTPTWPMDERQQQLHGFHVWRLSNLKEPLRPHLW
ncbi:MAG: ArnT family glycosyltransferase [Myxococcota bacterium]